MGEQVAIFDSGMGGLSLFQYYKQLSNPYLSFYADNKNFPYGNKEHQVLIDIVKEMIIQVKSIYDVMIIACNTASIIYEQYLKQEQGIYTIIDHTVMDILSHVKGNKIGIIGTQNTIRSAVYQNKLLNQKPELQLITQECSELVSYCENVDIQSIQAYIKQHLQIFKEEEVDTFVLGCTHFNFFKPLFETYLGPSVQIISSGFELIRQLNQEVNPSNTQDIIHLTQKDPIYLNKVVNFMHLNHNGLT